MNKGEYLDSILRSEKTVFTLKDVALLWQEGDDDSIRARLNYYVRSGSLHRVRRGVYVKDKNYDKLELAVRVFTPAYVSFETVLAREGLIFQYQDLITVASYLTREIVMDGQKYEYRKIKDSVLTNTDGVMQQENLWIASRERAFLDVLYSKTDYHFDNLRSVNWDTVESLLPIYDNKRLTKKVRQIRKETNDQGLQ